MSNQIPQLQQRPDFSYTIVNAVGGGCLTSSIPRNFARLIGLVLVVPQLVLLVLGQTNVPLLVVGVLLLGGSFVGGRKGASAAQEAPPETWTAEEQKLARVVQGAVAAGKDVSEVLREAGLADQISIDYGRTVADGRPVLVSLEARQKHQLVFGGSGSGKSKFIALQAAQDSLSGAALAVIDPHEELISDILRSAADLLASRGAILIWPDGPTRRIYPWNPLWVGLGRAPWQAADLVVAAVKRVWGLNDSNTYILDVLKHTTWALAGAGWTLLEGARFLTDVHFRAYIAQQANIPAVTAWVRTFDAKPPREQVVLTQTTLVRLNRLLGNPHLTRFVGCGVSDPNYLAAMRSQGVSVVTGCDLVGALNSGVHLFAAVPKRTFGEDQYLVAGLVQSAILTAALLRTPNDPKMPAIQLYMDEAGQYTTAEGLGRLLAEARKYKLSATVAMQGPQQAEEELSEELERNTAVKAVFGTDHVEEADMAASILYRYDPSAVKLDTRKRIKTGDGEAREIGQFQTYSPAEQHAYWAGDILKLPVREYVLKVRGAPETPLRVRTPNYVARFELIEAVRLIQRKRAGPVVSAEQIDAELAARHTWLEKQCYTKTARPSSSAPATSTARPAAVERVEAEPVELADEEEGLDL